MEKKFTPYIDEIFTALRHLIFTNILFLDYENNNYKFLYPAMQDILKNRFFSPVYIETLEKELLKNG